jgi:hypothetical protein
MCLSKETVAGMTNLGRGDNTCPQIGTQEECEANDKCSYADNGKGKGEEECMDKAAAEYVSELTACTAITAAGADCPVYGSASDSNSTDDAQMTGMAVGVLLLGVATMV